MRHARTTALQESPLSVGLVHWTFPPTTGGVESHLADLARLLSRAGCRVTVITGETVPMRDPHYDIVTTKLLRLDQIRAEPPTLENYVRDFREMLRDVAIEYQLDVIHGHNLHHFFAGPALAIEELRASLGLAVYQTFHETWPDVLHETPVYRGWDGNFAVSRFVQQQCYTRLGFRPRLFRLGIDLEQFRFKKPIFVPGTTPIILHPARLLPWKGVHLAVRMLATLREKGFAVNLIITDTQRIADWNRELESYRKEIFQMVADLNLSTRVVFRSAAFAEMPELYNQADIVIYPTIGEEPYGLVPLEAMASERPIVASRSGGIAETVLDGKTGYIVEVGDLTSLTEQVGRLLSNPQLARQFGAEGRRHVERRFDAKRYITALLKCYREPRAADPSGARSRNSSRKQQRPGLALRSYSET